MHRALLPLARTLTACLVLVVLPLKPARASWPHDANHDGVAVCPGLSYTGYPLAVADGSGGAFIALREGSYGNVRIQHVDAAGKLLWGTSGVKLSNGDTLPISMIADGFGGVICAWNTMTSGNADVYAQRVNSAGVVQWTANGVVVCNAANDQDNPMLAPDGYGGAFVAWQDRRVDESSGDVYVQHLNSLGTPQLVANGLLVCNASGMQTNINIASDGQNGAFITWLDPRGSVRAVYAQRLASNNSLQWAANGVLVAPGVTSDMWNPVVASDGHLGALIAWNDWRSGNSDVFVQRLNASGGALWTANGVQLVSVAGDQTNPVVVPDGSGGGVVLWVDGRGTSQDVYAQRVNAAGSTLWTSNGVALCTAAGTQGQIAGVPDGNGGVVAVWLDHRNMADNDLYAQHVSGAGSTTWTTDGVPLCVTSDDQMGPSAVSDGAGGALVAYFSNSTTSQVRYDTYCLHADRFGVLGGAEPTILSIDDVPNDQGGLVQLRWSPSWLDQMPNDPIAYYWIYRQIPTAAAQAALKSGAARLMSAGEAPVAGRTLKMTTQGAQTYYWIYLNTTNAEGHDGYGWMAGTPCDSIAGSNPLTYFMVEARYASVVGEYWDSNAMAGYSIDNLAPLSPAPFAGTYRVGQTLLSWGANSESDLAGYRLYRGLSAGFVPGAGNLVAALTGTSYVDAPGVPNFYKLTAVDIHGNESVPTLLQPAGTTGVAPGGAFALALAAPAPNPAGERTALAFTLPAEGRAKLALYDAAGRCVRVIADGEQGAGEHRVTLDLADARGNALPAGLYLVRLEVPGRTLVRRLAIVR